MVQSYPVLPNVLGIATTEGRKHPEGKRPGGHKGSRRLAMTPEGGGKDPKVTHDA